MVAAAWFGAVSTFLLVIGAGYTVWYARRAFAKQSDELTILQGQAADQQETKPEARDRRRAPGRRAGSITQAAETRHRRPEARSGEQGCRVVRPAGHAGPERRRRPRRLGRIHPQCIRPADPRCPGPLQLGKRELRRELVDGEPRRPTERTRVIPPEKTSFVPMPESVKNKHDPGSITEQNFVVSIEFTDVAGHKWERDPRGALGAP
jgi:hypothetical protein